MQDIGCLGSGIRAMMTADRARGARARGKQISRAKGKAERRVMQLCAEGVIRMKGMQARMGGKVLHKWVGRAACTHGSMHMERKE